MGCINLRRSGVFKFIVLLILACGSILLIFLIVSVMRARPAVSHPYFHIDAERRTLVIAHRGGAGLRPENTLEAFAHADRLGADILEMDVRRTKDDALILMHDATLDRTTDGSGSVASLTLDELKKFDAGFRHTTSGEQDFQFRGKGLTIPTIEEVFRKFPAKRLVLEIKRGESVEVASMLCRTIKDHHTSLTTLVASVSHEVITEFRRECPEVATSASADEARRFLTLTYTGLTSAYSPQFSALQVPPNTESVTVVTRSFVEAAHKRNLVVHPWTINDEQEMRWFINLNVDGIITDRPDLLINLLRESGE